MAAEYDYAAAMRRRREAAARCEPLSDGRRDPLLDPPLYGSQARAYEAGRLAQRRLAATYGKTDAELRAIANALIAHGWQTWEVVELLGVSPRECTCCPLHGRHRPRVYSSKPTDPWSNQEAA